MNQLLLATLFLGGYFTRVAKAESMSGFDDPGLGQLNLFTWFSHGSRAAFASFFGKRVLFLVEESERMRRGRAPSRSPSRPRRLVWA